MGDVIVIGQMHEITFELEASIEYLLKKNNPGSSPEIIFAITQSNIGGTLNNPLTLEERLSKIKRLEEKLGRVKKIMIDQRWYSDGDHPVPASRQLPKIYARYVIQEIQAKLGRDIDPVEDRIVVAHKSLVNSFKSLRYKVIEPKKNKTMQEISSLDSLEDSKTNTAFATVQEICADTSSTNRLIANIDQSGRCAKGSIDTEIDMDHLLPSFIPGNFALFGAHNKSFIVNFCKRLIDDEMYLFFVDPCAKTHKIALLYKNKGYFKNIHKQEVKHIYFRQLDMMQNCFPGSSIHTAYISSLLADLLVNDPKKSIAEFVKLRYEELKPEGRLIIDTTVAPKEPYQEIYITFSDGRYDKTMSEFKKILPTDAIGSCNIDGKDHFVMSKLHASEFFKILKGKDASHWDEILLNSRMLLPKDEIEQVLLENGFSIFDSWMYSRKYMRKFLISEGISTYETIDGVISECPLFPIHTVIVAEKK